MKNYYKLRFSVIAASVSAALLLSACQPANENVEAHVTEEEATVDATQTNTTAMDPHAGHDMSAEATDDESMTDMLKDYTESMTKMHEEMIVGMAYNDPDAAFAHGEDTSLCRDSCIGWHWHKRWMRVPACSACDRLPLPRWD